MYILLYRSVNPTVSECIKSESKTNSCIVMMRTGDITCNITIDIIIILVIWSAERLNYFSNQLNICLICKCLNFTYTVVTHFFCGKISEI